MCVSSSLTWSTMENERWNRLTMRERSEMMRIGVKSGFRKLADIKAGYNRFDEGGETQSGQGNVNDYIAARANQQRLKALEKSRTRTLPSVPEYPLSQEEREELEQSLILRKSWEKNIEKLYPYTLQSKKLWERDYPLKADVEELYFDGRTERDLNELEWTRSETIQLQSQLDKNVKYGYSCLKTASDNYGKVALSNVEFAQNPAKYGFQKIQFEDALEGDLTQAIRFDGKPHHAMMLDNKGSNPHTSRYNYSHGGSEPSDIVVGGRFAIDEKDYYRFVGSPQDSIQWKKDFDSGKRAYGGHLNLFSGEGNSTVETTPKLSSRDSTKHEVLFRSVDPSWGVPEIGDALPAYWKIREARKSGVNVNHGTPDDNAYLRKYLNLPHDESLTPESKYKPTVAKDPNAKYVGLSKPLKEGILSQLDTVRINKEIAEYNKAIGEGGNVSPEAVEGIKAMKRDKDLLEMGRDSLRALYSGKRPSVLMWDMTHPDRYEEDVTDSVMGDQTVQRSPLSPLGQYTLSMAPDKSYISVYDKYDFPWYANPVMPSKSKRTEFEIYDRIPMKEVEQRMKNSKK